MKIGSGAVEHPMAPDLGLSGYMDRLFAMSRHKSRMQMAHDMKIIGVSRWKIY